MGKATYLENKILNHVLKNTAYTQPATVYLALFTADPTDAGTTSSEVSLHASYTSGYARQAVTFGTVADGYVANSADIDFGPIVTTGTITVTHGMLMDASSGGNALWHEPVVIERAVTNGKTVRILAGDLSVEEN